MRSFTAERPQIGVAELARLIDGTRSTTHRYASTLAKLGLLEQDERRRYRIGLRAADLGLAALASIDWLKRARIELERLRSESSATITVSVRCPQGVMCVQRLPGRLCIGSELTPSQPPGTLLHLHATAPGKLLLAAADHMEHRALLRNARLTALTPRTIRTRRDLREQLTQIAEARIALDDEESTVAMRTLACLCQPLDDHPPAAIGLTLPAAHCTAKEFESRWSARLRQAADAIGALTGTTHPAG